MAEVRAAVLALHRRPMMTAVVAAAALVALDRLGVEPDRMAATAPEQAMAAMAEATTSAILVATVARTEEEAAALVAHRLTAEQPRTPAGRWRRWRFLGDVPALAVVAEAVGAAVALTVETVGMAAMVV